MLADDTIYLIAAEFEEILPVMCSVGNQLSDTAKSTVAD
jgi:hypothetical protein